MASKMFGRIGLLVAASAGVLSASAAADTIILNYVVTNTSNSTSTFTITDNIVSNIAGPTLITGSVTGTVTDLNGNGATVAAVAQGGSIYTALIDNNGVKNLMGSGFSFSAGQFLSESSVPQGFTNDPSVQVNNLIGIRLEFTLTAGDSASFTSIFTVTPVPAPGACVALVGLVALRRRRRN